MRLRNNPRGPVIGNSSIMPSFLLGKALNLLRLRPKGPLWNASRAGHVVGMKLITSLWFELYRQEITSQPSNTLHDRGRYHSSNPCEWVPGWIENRTSGEGHH